MRCNEENESFKANLKEILGANENMELPEGLLFVINTNLKRINVTLGKDAVVQNMQNDGAAFEGWILALKNKLNNYNVYIDADEEFEICGKKRNKDGKEPNRGTYNRCLYRLNRFRKQFGSFVTLSDKLKKLSDTLYIDGTEVDMKSIKLIVNRPTGEAGVNSNPEIMMEALFSSIPGDLLKETESIIGKPMENELHRQLPVGIFKDICTEKCETEYKIFTAGHAAIDLWSISRDGKDLCIYELKKEGKAENKKVGIVSELFFYANLMYDLYCVKDNNFDVAQQGASGRGFEKILGAKDKINKIHAFFLVEELHKEIQGVLPMLNSNTQIEYNLITYEKVSLNGKDSYIIL